MITAALLLAAALLAVVHGSNAGGTLLSAGLGVRSVRPVVGVLVIALGVGLAPLLLGTDVATTMAKDLVGLDGRAGELALLVAVLSAMVVTSLLSRRGLPTSLTLALLGGLAGVGVGAGMPVGWGHVGLVLLGVALAPLAGLVVCNVLARLMRRTPFGSDVGRGLRRLHVVTFSLLSLAFGSNDAQKLLAVAAVAAGPVGDRVEPRWWQLAAIGVLFALGTVLGARRMAATINSGLLPVRTADAVVAELATALVMFGSTGLGSPVGMAQTLSGALVGTGLTRGVGRIRWEHVLRIAGAWVVTLPAAFAAAALLGVAVSGW